jgi:carbon storage regulator CsrA
MLILHAKPEDKIYIGDDIRLTITYIEGRRVRIGFDVPKDIPVCRQVIAPMELLIKWGDEK